MPTTSSNDPTCSIARLPRSKKYALYEDVTVEQRTNYFRVSCRPIDYVAENDMELLSDIVTWGEMYLHHWQTGIYECSRCSNSLFSSEDKWKGPCVWPSFRREVSDSSCSHERVEGYNNYTCAVDEIYCMNCQLFVGHRFEDGKLKGDSHPDARWRY